MRGIKKDAPTAWIVVLLTAAVVLAALAVLLPQFLPRVNVHLGDGVFNARIADTQAQRTAGLSGVSKLEADDAMLLVFDSDDQWSIWMKDMKTSLDIIWLDNDQRVVHIVKHATPESYPDRTFTPIAEARYVLEVASGTVEKKNIAIGAKASFDLTQKKGVSW